MGWQFLEIEVVDTIPIIDFPQSKPDKDYNWDENYGWGNWSVQKLGGGRYKEQMIAISNKGQIYFSDV